MVLCVVSLLLAAALFPVTGFGEYPGQGPDGVLPGDGGPPGDGPGDGTTTGGTDGDRTTTDPSNPGGETGTETSDPGETETDARTTRATTTSSGEGSTTTTTTVGSDDDQDLGAVLLEIVGTLVSALLFVAVVVVLGAAVVAAGIAVGAITVSQPSESKLELDVWGLPSFTIPVGSAVQGVPQATTGFLVGLGDTVPSMLDELSELGAGLTGGIGGLLSGLGRTGRQLTVGLPNALGSVAGEMGSVLSGSMLAISGGLSRVVTGISNPLGKGGPLPGSDARDVDGAGDGASGPEENPLPDSVEDAWAELAATLYVRNRDAKTPAELARIAVERGLPEEAVTRLTAVFREVRYGPGGSTPRHLEVARRAVERIRNTTEGDG